MTTRSLTATVIDRHGHENLTKVEYMLSYSYGGVLVSTGAPRLRPHVVEVVDHVKTNGKLIIANDYNYAVAA